LLFLPVKNNLLQLNPRSIPFLEDMEEKSTGRNRKYLSRTDQERRREKIEKRKGK